MASRLFMIVSLILGALGLAHSQEEAWLTNLRLDGWGGRFSQDSLLFVDRESQGLPQTHRVVDEGRTDSLPLISRRYEKSSKRVSRQREEAKHCAFIFFL